MNFYKHYLGDYARDTQGLSLIQHGAYRLLLDTIYATEKPLPAELQDLYRVAGAMNSAERKAVEVVADKFFPIGQDGLRHNKRAELEILEAKSKSSKARAAAECRFAERTQSERKANALRTQSERYASHSHSQKPEQEKAKSTPIASRDESRSASTLAVDEDLNGQAVAYIPLIDGSQFAVSVSALTEFSKAYPAVDCKQTLYEIRAWCVANPKNRKTRGGALRFINAWLSREQNKAR